MSHPITTADPENELPEEINLGLDAEEEAEALDTIENGSESTLSDELPH